MPRSLTEYRRNAGYKTQQSLATVMGVRRNTVARWELGKRYPRPQTLPKLAKVLNTTEGKIITAITAAKEKSS